MRPLPALSRLLPHVLTGLALLGTANAQSNYATPYVFTTLAGTSSVGSTDGTGSAARFNGPLAVTVDSGGNLYVADSDNDIIRKITPAGAVTTLAGLAGERGAADGTGSAARFSYPRGVAVDATGNLYVADYDNHVIRKLTPAGAVTTFAGSAGAAGSADGTGSADGFNQPADVAIDASGNLYVADLQNSTVRKITPAGVVTTLAGAAGQEGHADGTGGAARLTFPSRLTLDSGGAVYLSESNGNVIRKITSAGVVTTLASVAPIAQPAGLAIDGAGTLYIADSFRPTIYRVSPSGTVTAIAGTNQAGGADGTGTSARFNQPQGLALDAAGNLYVADSANNAIRKISPAGQVTTFAGLSLGTAGVTTDGTGSAAHFNSPYGVAVGPTGDLFVSDDKDNVIRRVTPAGVVTLLAGRAGFPGGGNGIGAAAGFTEPKGLAVDAAGNVYVAEMGAHDTRKITPAGVVTTFAGAPGAYGNIDGALSVARLFFPMHMAVDGGGNVYVAEAGTDDIRKVTPAGIFSTVVGREYPYNLFDKQVAVDATGNLYVGDRSFYRKLTPAGVYTIIAGQDRDLGSADGPGGVARFNESSDMAVDAQGNLFVADTGNHLIRKISPAGIVSTVAGLAGSSGSADGVGRDARFDFPHGIAVDSGGTLYVTSGTTLRVGRQVGAPAISTQPQNATVAVGGSVQFSVAATGVPDTTYQWYLNGAAFSGGTSSSLSFSNARSTDAGDYTVVVTNALGSVTSAKATLTVSAATTPTSSSGGNSGGGGGAPSGWFILALFTLAAARSAELRKVRNNA